MNHEELRAAQIDLAAKYPQIGLTLGYIGNCGPKYDNRSWYFWTEVVQGKGMWGTDDKCRYSLGDKPEEANVCTIPSDPTWRGNYKLTPEQFKTRVWKPLERSDIEDWIVNKVLPLVPVGV